jgi:hypothetical protein
MEAYAVKGFHLDSSKSKPRFTNVCTQSAQTSIQVSQITDTRLFRTPMDMSQQCSNQMFPSTMNVSQKCSNQLGQIPMDVSQKCSHQVRDSYGCDTKSQ